MSIRLLAVCAAFLLSACGLQTAELYEGPPRSEAELAIVETHFGCAHCVDSIRIAGQDEAIFLNPCRGVGGEKFKLAPGRYEFGLHTRSYGINLPTDVEVGEVKLQAGQTYHIFEHQGGSSNNTPYVWMEDAVGEVLLGEEPCFDTILFMEWDCPAWWR